MLEVQSCYAHTVHKCTCTGSVISSRKIIKTINKSWCNSVVGIPGHLRHNTHQVLITQSSKLLELLGYQELGASHCAANLSQHWGEWKKTKNKKKKHKIWVYVWTVKGVVLRWPCQISSTGMHEEDYAVLSNIILFKSILAHIDTPGFGQPKHRSAAVSELGQTSAPKTTGIPTWSLTSKFCGSPPSKKKNRKCDQFKGHLRCYPLTWCVPVKIMVAPLMWTFY